MRGAKCVPGKIKDSSELYSLVPALSFTLCFAFKIYFAFGLFSPQMSRLRIFFLSRV